MQNNSVIELVIELIIERSRDEAEMTFTWSVENSLSLALACGTKKHESRVLAEACLR